MSRAPQPVAPAIPGFEYADALGDGGFSHVYRYTELGLGRSVAVKVLLADVDQASFRAEAKVMAQLGNHPSIVSIYQAGLTAEGRAFLVMEYCPPPHLGLRLRTQPLSVAKSLEVSIQLAGAVETAHKLGILHRDIKPANILFTEFGRPALTDFGISEAMGRAEAGQGIGMSPPWAPPEQLRVGAPMGPTGDVYALGATLWTCLVGRSPFSQPGGANDPGSIAQRIRTQPVPRTGRADVPDSLDGVLRVAMAKEPDQRFVSALELARALQSVQAELHLAVTPLDVRDERLDLAVATEERDVGGTHVTGFVAIDPEVPLRPSRRWDTSTNPGTAPGHASDHEPATDRGAGYSRVTVGDADDATAMSPAGSGRRFHEAAPRHDDRISAPAQTPEAPVGPGTDTRPQRLHRTAVGVGVALITTVGAVVVVKTVGSAGSGTTPDEPVPSTGVVAQDPTVKLVPAPSNVTVQPGANRNLIVTWTNPAPEAGDQYLVKLDDPVSPRAWTVTDALTATVQGAPGRRCVVVAILRADQRSSTTPERACPDGAR